MGDTGRWVMKNTFFLEYMSTVFTSPKSPVFFLCSCLYSDKKIYKFAVNLDNNQTNTWQYLINLSILTFLNQWRSSFYYFYCFSRTNIGVLANLTIANSQIKHIGFLRITLKLIGTCNLSSYFTSLHWKYWQRIYTLEL